MLTNHYSARRIAGAQVREKFHHYEDTGEAVLVQCESQDRLVVGVVELNELMS